MPAPALDLNKAGLVELERIPGVGFIRAQAILDYRDKHGPFREVDELLLVAGITPEELLELKQHLNVGGTEAAYVLETPAEDYQILLVQARNALVQGDIPLAISRYGILIDKKQMTEEDIKLQFITPAITAKWNLDHVTVETRITDGKINLKGNFVFREKPKKADYVLYINANNPIAIIEAKDNKKPE